MYSVNCQDFFLSPFSSEKSCGAYFKLIVITVMCLQCLDTDDWTLSIKSLNLSGFSVLLSFYCLYANLAYGVQQPNKIYLLWQSPSVLLVTSVMTQSDVW